MELTLTLLLLPLGFGFASSENGGCPKKCECDDKKVKCFQADLTEIPDNIPNSENVTVLVIVGNNLTKIRTSDLRRFPNVSVLDLSYNFITDVEGGAFQELRHLESLDLSFNNLTSLPDNSFLGLVKLKDLHLSQNKLSTLNKFLNNAPGLLTVTLKNNLIEEVREDAFNGSLALTLVDLAKNLLAVVPSRALERLPALHTVVLSANIIPKLGDCSFGRMNQLENLQLQDNEISFISDTAFSPTCSNSSGSSALTSLDLAENALTSVPVKSLYSLNNLRTLRMNSNRISVISSGSFTNKSSLTTVALSYMPSLKTVEDHAFVDLESLYSVFIHDCRSLSTFSPAIFKNVPQLHDLQIYRNGFKSIDENLLTWKENLTISLSGNPWVCKCPLKWIPGYYHNETASNVSQTNVELLQCAAPNRLKGAKIISLSAESFLCEHPQKSVHARLHTAVIAASICAVVAILLLVFFKFRNRICIFVKRQFRYKAHRDNRELFSVQLSGIIDENETEPYYEDPTLDLRLVDPRGR